MDLDMTMQTTFPKPQLIDIWNDITHLDFCK